MSTTGILNKLAEVETAITGIQSAWPNEDDHIIPGRVLTDDELPAFINVLGTERYQRTADDSYEVAVIITALLLVQRAVTGLPGEATAAISPWRDAITNYLLARPTLEGYTGLLDTDDAGVSGSDPPGKVPWLNVTYLGVTFDLKYVEQRTIENED